VYVVLALESAVEVFFSPAEQAMLPLVVEDADLVTANAMNGQCQQAARLVGSALGGVVAATGGITAIAIVDATTFAMAALLVSRIRSSGRAARPDVPEPADVLRGSVARLTDEWRHGLRTAWNSRVVRVLLAFALITSTGEGVMGTLFAPYVRNVLHGGAQVYGLISGVQAIGGVVGGFVVTALPHRWSPVRMLGVGATVFGLVDLAIFLYPLAFVSWWPAAVGMIVVGVPGAFTMAGYLTLFQRSTVDESRGRVFSLLGLARSVSMVVGTVGAGLLGNVVGIMPVLAVQGAGYVVAGTLVLGTITSAGVPERRPVVA
jgi:predicted MFS family arabinose efflux permease